MEIGANLNAWWDIADFDDIEVPDFIDRAGERQRTLYQQFIARHANSNTRRAYSGAIDRFCKHLAKSPHRSFSSIQLKHMKHYFTAHSPDTIGALSFSTIKLHFIILRLYFDYLAAHAEIIRNPLSLIRLPSIKRGRGQTPAISTEEVKRLIGAIKLRTERDYRDRALIGTMLFGLYRISAALSIRSWDYRSEGDVSWITALEKGARLQEMPVHPVLKNYLDEYIEFANIPRISQSYLFQSTNPRSGKLIGRPMQRNTAFEMTRRRSEFAGIDTVICNHSFRATGITTYLANEGDLDNARILAGHSRTDTTRLYDRNIERRKMSEIIKIDYGL